MRAPDLKARALPGTATLLLLFLAVSCAHPGEPAPAASNAPVASVSEKGDEFLPRDLPLEILSRLPPELTSCERDADCEVVSQSCCCPVRAAYAFRKDREDAVRATGLLPSCEGARCPTEGCRAPTATCTNGKCSGVIRLFERARP